MCTYMHVSYTYTLVYPKDKAKTFNTFGNALLHVFSILAV
jgi:hypothetical protein